MGVDYLDHANRGAKHTGLLTRGAREYISWVEQELGTRASFIGTGPDDEELIDRLKEEEDAECRCPRAVEIVLG